MSVPVATGAMRAAINCALANRQIITHLIRRAFAEILPQAELKLLYDVSHNTCKVESHRVDGNPNRPITRRRRGHLARRSQAPSVEKTSRPL